MNRSWLPFACSFLILVAYLFNRPRPKLDSTVGRAYAELESAGLVSTKRRVGTIVTAADRAPIPGDVVEAADRLAAAVGSAGLTKQVAIAVLHAALRRNGSVGQSAPGDPGQQFIIAS